MELSPIILDICAWRTTEWLAHQSSGVQRYRSYEKWDVDVWGVGTLEILKKRWANHAALSRLGRF